jgi:hypothetical protein
VKKTDSKLERFELYVEYIFEIVWRISSAICVASLAVLMLVFSIHYIVNHLL